MTAKEYLRQAKVLQIKIRQKEKLLAELREKAIGGGCLNPDGVRVQTSARDGSRLEEEVIKYVELAHEIKEDIRRYYAKRNEIIDTIHALDDSRYIIVLHAKWIDGESLERIAADMNYNFNHVRKLYWAAMKEVGQLMSA